jgi:hypothetical protein
MKQGKRRVVPTMANIRLSAAQAAVDAEGKLPKNRSVISCSRDGSALVPNESVPLGFNTNGTRTL